MDARSSEWNWLRALVNHIKPQPLPCASGNGEVELARAAGFAEDRLAPGQCLPSLAVGCALNLHRLEERAGRGFQRNAIKRLGQASLKGEGGKVAVHRNLK